MSAATQRETGSEEAGVVIRTPDVSAIEAKRAGVADQIQALEVVDEASQEKMIELGKAAKALLEEVEETFKEPAQLAHRTWRAITGARKKHTEPLEKALRLARGRLGAYLDKKKAEQKAAEEKARVEAQRAAEDAQVELAADLEAARAKEAAERTLAAPTVTPSVRTPEKKTEGMSSSAKWSAELVDMQALLRAIVEGRAPVTLVRFDQTAANKWAQALGAGAQADGVRVEQSTQVALR